MPELKIAATLPGEGIAIAVIEMLTALWKDAGPEQKLQMWDWWIKDMERWRKFWKVPEE
jgi:hypothetical protein